MMFEHIIEKYLEKRFKKKLKEVSEHLQKTKSLLYSSYVPKKYTVKQLRDKSKGDLITVLFIRYKHIMHYRDVVFEIRNDMRELLREYRKCLIENYQLRKCKNKKGMKRKLGVKSFKTRIIIR